MEKTIETFGYNYNKGKLSLVKINFQSTFLLLSVLDKFYDIYIHEVENLVNNGKDSELFNLKEQKESLEKGESVKAEYNLLIEGVKAFLDMPKTQFANNNNFEWKENVAYEFYKNYINSNKIPTLYRTKLLQSFLHYSPKNELEKCLRKEVFNAVGIKVQYKKNIRNQLQLFEEMTIHNEKCKGLSKDNKENKNFIQKLQESYFNSIDFADNDQMFKEAIPITLELAAFKKSGEFNPITCLKK